MPTSSPGQLLFFKRTVSRREVKIYVWGCAVLALGVVLSTTAIASGRNPPLAMIYFGSSLFGIAALAVRCVQAIADEVQTPCAAQAIGDRLEIFQFDLGLLNTLSLATSSIQEFRVIETAERGAFVAILGENLPIPDFNGRDAKRYRKLCVEIGADVFFPLEPRSKNALEVLSQTLEIPKKGMPR